MAQDAKLSSYSTQTVYFLIAFVFSEKKKPT